MVLVERAVDGDHGVRLVQPVNDRGEQRRDQRCTANGDDPAQELQTDHVVGRVVTGRVAQRFQALLGQLRALIASFAMIRSIDHEFGVRR